MCLRGRSVEPIPLPKDKTKVSHLVQFDKPNLPQIKQQYKKMRI